MLYERHVGAAVLVAVAIVAIAPGVPQAQEPSNACARADALRTGGEKEAARAAYIDLLVQGPTERCAIVGLKALAAAGPPTCNAGDTLRALGYDTEAKTAYVKVLEADGTSTCASAGLSALRDDRSERFVAWTKDAGEVAGAIAFLTGLGLVLMLIGGYVARGSDRRPAPWVRQRFVPKVKIESFENATTTASDGEALASAVRVALASPEPGSRPYSLMTISATEGLGETIGEIGDAVVPLKAAGALVGALQSSKPNAQFVLNATVRTVDSRVAASAFLEESGRSRKADTLVAPPSLSRPLDALGYALAAWTQHGVQEINHGSAAYQTQNAPSYALLAAGSRLQAQGSVDDARSLYVDAIKLDPHNGQARIALAVLDGLDPDQTLRASDNALLGASLIEGGIVDLPPGTLRALEPGRLEPWFFSSAWHQGMYLAAAHRYHWAIRESGPSPQSESRQKSLVEAEVFSRRLLVVALLTLMAPQSQSPHMKKTVPAQVDATRLLEFLDDIVEATAAVLLAGARVQLGAAYDADGSASPPRHELANELSEEEATKTRTVTPEQLIAFARATSGHGRVLYNLACFHSELAWRHRESEDGELREQALERAEGDLRAALPRLPIAELQILVRWVGRDPSLQGLRVLAPERFAAATRMLGRFRIPEQKRQAERFS